MRINNQAQLSRNPAFRPFSGFFLNKRFYGRWWLEFPFTGKYIPLPLYIISLNSGVI